MKSIRELKEFDGIDYKTLRKLDDDFYDIVCWADRARKEIFLYLWGKDTSDERYKGFKKLLEELPE